MNPGHNKITLSLRASLIRTILNTNVIFFVKVFSIFYRTR